MHPRLLIPFCVLGVAGGCGRSLPPPEPMVPVAAVARLYYDNAGGFSDSTRIVVRDQATWAEIWRQATRDRSEPPPLPLVDFRREMVLVVGAGRMTPEDEIRVDSVGMLRERTEAGDVIDVLAAVVRTSVGCGRFAAEAYPLEIVRVRHFGGQVRFLERRVSAGDCPGGASDAGAPARRGQRATYPQWRAAQALAEAEREDERGSLRRR